MKSPRRQASSETPLAKTSELSQTGPTTSYSCSGSPEVRYRGHGRSVRENGNPYVVHVERFHDYVLDLVHLIEKRVKPAAGMLPVYLYCHSMGGCIGAWTIEEYPGLFDKAVLSSPMLGLSFGKIPVPVVYMAASLKGVGEKRKEALSL